LPLDFIWKMKKNKKASPIATPKKSLQTKIKQVQKPTAKKQKVPATPVKKVDIKKISKSDVKVPVKKIAMPLKPVPKIAEVKPKGLYSIEYEMNSSPDVLFEFISTPGGLEKWFADRVYIIESNFVFNWEDGEQRQAKQVGIKEKDWVRFHWLDEPEKRYFEFKIVIDDLTSEVALIVSDFADNPAEQEESTRLWNQQISDLHHSIGSAA
jgi:START-like superfamily domain